MSTSVPIKSCLTKEEFDRLWYIYDHYPRNPDASDGGFLGVHGLTEAAASQQKHVRKCGERDAVKNVLMDAFSGAAETHRRNYETGHVIASKESIGVLTDAFNDMAQISSGLVIPFAKIITGMLERTYGPLSKQDSEYLSKSIFLRVASLREFMEDPDTSDSITPERQDYFQKVLNGLVKQAYGIDMSGRGRHKIKYAPCISTSGVASREEAHHVTSNISITILSRALFSAKEGQKGIDQTRALTFLDGVKEANPGLLDEKEIQEQIKVICQKIGAESDSLLATKRRLAALTC